MSAPEWPEEGLPADARLRAAVLATADIVTAAAPVALALLGAPPQPLEADAGDDRAAALERLAGVLRDLENVDGPLGGDDELDRLSLCHGVRRALAAADASHPTGPEALEQHLQLRLLRLLDGAPADLESLVQAVETGPAFLRGARPPAAAGSAAAGRLALEAAGRLPRLLDACAAAGQELARGDLRLRLEGALGPLLQAGAEEAGWLLKEYLPAAADQSAVPPDTLRLGLGMPLEEVEAVAEAALADAVLADPLPALGAEPGEAELLVQLESFRETWFAETSAPAAGIGSRPGTEVEVMRAPSWLEPLVAPVGLVLPGPLSETPERLLVGAGEATAGEVALLYAAEYLPWSASRRPPRLARLLLPSPDAGEGWRAHVRASTPGGPLPWASELSWRAALGLAAIAMSSRGASLDDAAELVAAESGLPPQSAVLQCLHLRRRPLQALTFLAGRAAVARMVAGSGVERFLEAGPLSAAAVGRLPLSRPL
ncbi:MAG: hypothetical protein ABR573_04940 [Candidatus Dormibacteria bacterium]